MKKSGLGVAMAAGLMAVPALAQAQGLGVEATGGKAAGEWGAELGASYSMGLGPFTVRPVVGAFIPTESGASTSIYAKGEATFTIPAVAELGLGARLAHEKVRAYALAAFPILPKLKLTLQGGAHYGAAGLRFSF